MDCFILTNSVTGVVERLVVGRPAAPGYTLDLITEATSIVAIGWKRQSNGAFVPPAIEAPPVMSDADRIAALEERFAALIPPPTPEGSV